MRSGTYKVIYQYLLIMAGVLMLALGINIYLEPHDLVTGGATGLGIIVQSLSETFFGFNIPLWLTNLVVNAPLLLIGAKVKGRLFIIRTLFATLFLSFTLFATESIPIGYFQSDMLLASVFGGLLSGAGIGLVFRNMATTGGSDLAAGIINHYHKSIPLSKIMLVIDTVIIVLGFFIFGAERAMYAIISVYISAKTIDAVLEGMYFAKAAFIISERTEEVAAGILEELDRGATLLRGIGAYTGAERNVILCVTSAKEMIQLRDIVARNDKNAFIIVADVREVLGEGFQPI